jgi:serine/threonine protein kinase
LTRGGPLVYKGRITEDTTPPKKRTSETGSPTGGSSRERKAGPSLCPECRAENPAGSLYCSRCAAPLKTDSGRTVKGATFEIERGDLFADRYEIIEPLGQGGMGKVFKAYDRKVGEVVALKLIRPEISVNDKAIERFRNELKFARKISHRNVCRMHDMGEEGFFRYITMEYVSGEDLKRFIRRAGTLSAGKAVHIAKQVGEGLAEAHRLGVVHRDLKPQNIMIDQDGNAHIMDFGIARFADAEGMTGSGVMIGTPEYMSPEQAELKDVDARADIYSLGVALYEMVSGRVPFEGETPLSVAMKHKTEKPRNVREVNPQVPPALAAIVEKCMAKAPDARFQTAEELVAALDRVEKGLGTGERVVAEKKTGTTKEITVTLKTKKLAVPAIVLGVLTIGAIIVFLIMPRIGRKPASSPALQEPAGKSSPQTPPDNVANKPAVPVDDAKEPPSTTSPEGKTPGTGGDAPAVKEEPKPQAPAPSESTSAPATQDPEAAPAGLARARASAARVVALKTGVEERSLFVRLGDVAMADAQKAQGQKRYADARSLCVVSEKLYRTSQEKGKDEDRIKSLRRFVGDLREQVDDLKPKPIGNKVLDAARESEKQAKALQGSKDVENAAKYYVQAANGYQRTLFWAAAAKGR